MQCLQFYQWWLHIRLTLKKSKLACCMFNVSLIEFTLSSRGHDMCDCYNIEKKISTFTEFNILSLPIVNFKWGDLYCLCCWQYGPLLVISSIKANLLFLMKMLSVPTKHPLIHASRTVWSQLNAELCIVLTDSVSSLTRMLNIVHMQARCYIIKCVLEYTVCSISNSLLFM